MVTKAAYGWTTWKWSDRPKTQGGRIATVYELRITELDPSGQIHRIDIHKDDIEHSITTIQKHGYTTYSGGVHIPYHNIASITWSKHVK